jgi:hypothetical protein
MPRPWIEEVCDWQEIDTGRVYRMCVSSIEKDKGGSAITGEVEHLEREQIGRKHSFSLTLPCRPEGPTASFLRACGQEVRVGIQIRPQEVCIGKVIGVRLRQEADGTYQPCAFEAIEKKEDIATTRVPTSSSTCASGKSR